MTALRQFAHHLDSLPARDQTVSRQHLKALHEHALIESAVSSNHIERVKVEHTHISALVFGAPFL